MMGKVKVEERRVMSVLAALLAVVLVGGCGGAEKQSKDGAANKRINHGETEVGSTRLVADGNTAIQRIDVNGDEKPDVYKFFQLIRDGKGTKKDAENAKKVLIRKEMDVNFDQRIDIVQYYSGKSGKEVMIREEMDLDFDGRVDSTRHYKGGNVHLVELDLGFDGKTDTWRYYQLTKTEAGKTVNRLIEKRRDTNNDAAVDVWEYYTKGQLTKIGYDTTGNGSPDRFKKMASK